MTIIQITTHKTDAKARMLFQDKGKETIEGLHDSYGGDQIQDFEDAAFTLFSRLDIDASEGVQLDRIGDIVGQGRLGLDDDTYRIFLRAKIGINVSEGDHERIISVFRLLSQATLVHLMSLGDGELDLGTNGTIIPSLIQAVFASMQASVSAGVRINRFTFFDDVEPFAFASEGDTVIGDGFNDAEGDSIGGKLAEEVTRDLDFAFDGSDPLTDGFGDPADPLIGGVFLDI